MPAFTPDRFGSMLDHMNQTANVGALRTDRRSFLKVSAAGAAALSTISAGAWVSGCSTDKAAAGMHVLRQSDAELLRAMIPAVMKGKITPQNSSGIDSTLQSFDVMMADLSPGVIKVVREAFDALTFAPTRALLAGQWGSWTGASLEDAESALARLRDSRLELLNAVYAAVIRLVASAYYLVPENALATGYPGPPTKVAS